MEIIVFGTKNIGHFTMFVQNKTFFVPFYTFNQIASQARISPNWYNSHHGTDCTLENNLVLSTCIHMLCDMQFCTHITQGIWCNRIVSLRRNQSPTPVLSTPCTEVQGLLINSLTIDRCIKNCHHIMLIFCEIALGWMAIILSQYW